jgi:transcriptional regulator with XRE-family HTH domain
MGSSKWGDTVFGRRLRNLRDRKGWTQTELAEQLTGHGMDMTAAQVARIEKGDRSVRAVEAAVLADLYGLSVDALLGKRARPKADLLDALTTFLDIKEHARRSVSSVERALREAAEALADADTRGRYAELVDDCENACKVLAAAAQAVAGMAVPPSISRAEINQVRRQRLLNKKASK